MSEPLKSVEEFIEWTEQLDGQMLLYRCLADANWKVESSAYRRIKFQGNPHPVTFQNYIERLLDNASLRGFRNQNDRMLSDLELLAELQHFGAATCLIDFTENALIALWFACQKESDKDGKVIAMPTSDTNKFSTITYRDSTKTISEFLNEGRQWKWTPRSQNNRIIAQQSVFVFGEAIIEENLYTEIQIDAGSKKDILATLDKAFGVKEENLFNDLPGFALHNAHDRIYDDYTAREYTYWGIKFHLRGDFEKAKYYYEKAIILDPQFAEAYNNRGVAKNDSGDHQGAISDYDKAIELNPLHAGAYNNRGNAKNDSGQHEEAIADYDEVVKYNPQSAEAYNNRGVAKRALKDYKGAITDYSKALELNPRYVEAYNNRGVAKNDSGDRQGAISDYDKAIELNPQYAKAYWNRGDAKNSSGDETGARKDWDRAKETDPNL